MANLLEAGQTGLVVVAVDHPAEHITLFLSNATTKIVANCVRADLEAEFAAAIQNATPAPPSSSPAIDDAGGTLRL
jgi:hypothetical protein